MRVAYLFMTYPMAAQPFAISDVQALEALGHTVDIYALRGRGPDHTETVRRYGLKLPPTAHPGWASWLAVATPQGTAVAAFLLRVVIAHLHRKPVQLAKALALLPRMVEITVRLRRDPPDVVHAFWGHYPSLVLLLAARFAPSIHRSIFLGAYDLTTHLFSLAPRVAREADSVWTHAEANLPLLDRLGVPRTKVSVVQRGIPLDLADGPKVAKTPGRICTAANFQKEKNLDLVVESFALFAQDRPEATLLIAGDGQERSALEALVATRVLDDRVSFTGFLARDQLFEEMQRAELFVFLSTKPSERLPNVVKEAMLAGTACLVSRTPDIEQLVQPDFGGEIVDDLTPETIASRMETLVTDPERDAKANSGEAHVRGMFSSTAAMARYAEVWQRQCQR